MTLTWTTVLTLGLFLGTLRPSAGPAQTPSDVLRGRVVDTAGAPLGGARVIATADSTRQTRDTRTGADGRYTLVFPGGVGGYSLTIAAIGRHPVRVSVARVGTTVAPIPDVVLHALAIALDAVVVTSRKRQLPQPTSPYQFSPGAGADERRLNADSSGLSPAAAGNLNALASRTPGFSLTPSGGLSALGASANQNITTLNGLGFTGAKIPLGANVSVSAASSTFDPSRGGFSGGQTALQPTPGTDITNRSLHFSLDAPAFQLTDAASRQLGQPQPQFNGQFSWAGDGPLINPNTANYNVSVEVDHTSSAMPAWGSEGLAALQRIGIAPDSVTRTLAALHTAGVPLAPAHLPGAMSTTSVTTLSQVNFTNGWRFTGYGDLESDAGAGFTPTATVGSSGTASDVKWNLQLAQDHVIDSVIQNAWQTSFSLHDARTSPYLALPDGNLFMASQFPDSSVESTTLQFGGAGNSLTAQRDWQWETRNTTSWNSLDNTHTFTLMADATLLGQHLDPGQSYGSYAYSSLADLAANTPASFTRTVGGHPTTASVWDGALSFGDDWRPTRALQMQYGVRLDGAHFLSTPAENPLVDSLFGVRTDHVPNGLQLSPRVGFTWLYGGSPVTGAPVIGLNPISGEDRNHGVIRGGIGEFWSTVSPLTVATYMNATGVGGALQQLQCLGAAIPAAQWSLFASDPAAIPTQCLASGSGGLASTAPSVQLLGPDYATAHSWRGNLSWTSTVHRALVEVTGRYSRDITPSSVDLNFQGIPQFTLPAEGNRPVFVPPASIIPATGAVSDVASRIAPAFDQVTSAQGALQDVMKAVTLSLSPANPFGTGLIPHLDYTLMTSAAQSDGFTGATGSDPRTVEWAPGATVRHTINLQLQKQFRRVTLAFNDYLFSGVPYTPTVGGDILGTGASLDRAFVFDPAHTSDPTLAAGMRALLQTTAGSTRSCLQAQLGRIAGTNSCVGPWNSQMSLSASVDGPTLHLTDRLHLQFYVANPLGGVDQVLHGADHLHGWGALNVPNPVLLQPTGFNATTRQFAYTVNPTFGSPLPQQTVARSPMTVTLGGSITLGMRPDEQQVNEVLAPGRHGHRGSRWTAEQIRRQFVFVQTYLFDMPVRVRDTLLLTRPQIQEIQELIRVFDARADSVWAPEAAHLAALGDRYDLDAETKQYQAVNRQAMQLIHDFGLAFKHVLTASQWELMPAYIQQIFTQ